MIGDFSIKIPYVIQLNNTVLKSHRYIICSLYNVRLLLLLN